MTTRIAMAKKLHHLWFPGWHTTEERRRGATCSRCGLKAWQVEREGKLVVPGVPELEPRRMRVLIIETQWGDGMRVPSFLLPNCTGEVG